MSIHSMQLQKLTVSNSRQIPSRYYLGPSTFKIPTHIYKAFKTTFYSEFLLNHLHSNHKHRRYDGESLDMTMVVPQVNKRDVILSRVSFQNHSFSSVSTRQVEVMSQSMPSRSVCNPSPSQQATLQTWPFVEIVAHKRYFYLEAQSFNDSEGHPEVFIWLWFFGEHVTIVLLLFLSFHIFFGRYR